MHLHLFSGPLQAACHQSGSGHHPHIYHIYRLRGLGHLPVYNAPHLPGLRVSHSPFCLGACCHVCLAVSKICSWWICVKTRRSKMDKLLEFVSSQLIDLSKSKMSTIQAIL